MIDKLFEWYYLSKKQPLPKLKQYISNTVLHSLIEYFNYPKCQ